MEQTALTLVFNDFPEDDPPPQQTRRPITLVIVDDDVDPPPIPITTTKHRPSRTRKPAVVIDPPAERDPAALSIHCRHCDWGPARLVAFRDDLYAYWTEAARTHRQHTQHDCWVGRIMPVIGPPGLTYCWHGNNADSCRLCHPNLAPPICVHGEHPWHCAQCSSARRAERIALGLPTTCIHGTDTEEACPQCRARGCCRVCDERTSNLYIVPPGWNEYRCPAHAAGLTPVDPREEA